MLFGIFQCCQREVPYKLMERESCVGSVDLNAQVQLIRLHDVRAFGCTSHQLAVYVILADSFLIANRASLHQDSPTANCIHHNFQLRSVAAAPMHA